MRVGEEVAGVGCPEGQREGNVRRTGGTVLETERKQRIVCSTEESVKLLTRYDKGGGFVEGRTTIGVTTRVRSRTYGGGTQCSSYPRD